MRQRFAEALRGKTANARRRLDLIAMDGEQMPPGTAGEPRAPAISFVTTEHFTLQGARSKTISESTGRATMFLSSVSGGLVALGLVATAAGVGAAFYAFAAPREYSLLTPRACISANPALED